MASRCQRSILSCSRCRKRKMKCDRQLPSCSQCLTAKTTCTGISANTATDVPRSIVQHLESEIARLETELAQDGRLDMDAIHASGILLQMPSLPSRSHQTGDANNGDNEQDATLHAASGFVDSRSGESGDNGLTSPYARTEGIRSRNRSRGRGMVHDLRPSILSGKPLQAMVAATLPYGTGATGLLSRVRMGMTPSAAQVSERGRTPAAFHTNHRANRRSSNNTLLDATVLRSMPVDIVQRLIRKYLNTIQKDHPFLVASSVMQQFQNVAEILGWQVQEEQQQQHTAGMPIMANHDFLIVYLVLAISVTLGSANDGHEERCMALSMSLFEEGIQHFYSLPSFPSDIAWLQTILLVLLYATIFPRSANVWVLSGAAMRAYLELGLHREPSDESLVDGGLAHEMLDLRRRVFWAAYCMDRSICSALQRPLSTPDAAINTKLPAQIGEDDTFLSSIAYHRLLSEMLHVHFQCEPIAPQLTWDDWLTSTETKLRAWHRRYGGNSSSSRPPSHSHHHHHHHQQEMMDFNMARGLMILHRPSPRVPTPPPRSLLAAFEAAATAARLHREHIRAGFFRRPWLAAHHAREAATIVLFCLRHGSEAIAARFGAAAVFEMAKLLTSNLLAIAAQAHQRQAYGQGQVREGQGWSEEVRVYASVYERLLTPLLERIFLDRRDLSDAFGPAQDAELMRLLYPGPAHLEKLRLGWRQPQRQLRLQHQQEGGQVVEEPSPFDFTLFMGDDDFWAAGGDLELAVGGEGGGGGEHAGGGGQRWDTIGLSQGAEFDFGMAI